jgi:hypothetical protein
MVPFGMIDGKTGYIVIEHFSQKQPKKLKPPRELKKTRSYPNCA